MHINALSSIDRRPLNPQRAGKLDLAAPDQMGRTFLSGASGLTIVGKRAWVAADDSPELASYRSFTQGGDSHQVLPYRERRYDFEALTRLDEPRAGVTTIMALGSGSGPDRGVAALQDVSEKTGHVVSAPRSLNVQPLYDELNKHLPHGVNIEGATVRTVKNSDAKNGVELILLHRGRKLDEPNTLFVLDAEKVRQAARNNEAVTGAALLAKHEYELGELNGEKLAFSDVVAAPDGRLIFTATAESEDDAYGNGELRGSAVGVIDENLKLRSVRPLTGMPRKVEGIEYASRFDSDVSRGQKFLLVTDPDDKHQAAEALTVTLD